MIDIELNGATYRITEGQNLESLVASLELAQQTLAVAVNRCVVPRHAWQERLLQPLDQVDVVRAIGGG
jgi:sulfur carrier protein